MPWAKKGDSVGPEATNGGGQAEAGAGRRSKFGPPVTSGGAIPPPTIMTQAPTLAGSQVGDMVEAGYSATANFPPPPPPMAAPPPVLEPPAQMMAPAPGQAPWGYGYTASMPPPEMAPPAPEKPPAKPSRNPRPQPMDMSAMIAAAQQHMQKNLTAKLASIGFPLSTFGMSTSQPSETESIPLPGDPSGVDINIADIPTPSADIPLPPPQTAPVTLSDDCVPPR